jgi:hypothetical protein
MMDEKKIGAITTTYEIWSPEDVEHGEAGERGWIDEMGYEIEPEEDDYEEHREFYEEYDASDDDIHDEVVAAMVVDFLKDEGVTEDSSGNSGFSVGTWYTAYKYKENFGTGEIENRSYHLEDFTPEQEEMIYEGMTGMFEGVS